MIFIRRRLLLQISTVHVVALAGFAAVLVSGAPLHAQFAAPSTSSVFPEAPRPQFDITTAASLAPAADLYSTSLALLSEPQTQTQTQTTPSTQTPPPPLTEEEKRRLAEEQLQLELHQRMGGVVPNFNAVLNGNALPLSPRQKMRAAFRSAIDPYQFGLAIITAGYGQATDSHSSIDQINGTHHGYPQGWAGYGCRYGANYVDQFNGTIIGNGILPVLLKQDARYFRMGKGSFTKRFLYSLSTTVVAHGDNGKRQPNYSNVLGNLISGGISNLYYPRSERGFALTVEQGLTVTAEGSFGALLIEFYPDIRKHIHGKRPPQP